MDKVQAKVLVLGGGGFIGQHVVRALVDGGVPTVVFDRNGRPALASPHGDWVQGSFADTAQLEAVIKQHGVTHVVHLVSTTLPKSSNEDKPYDVSSNVIQTLHLLDLCVKYRVKKVLFMSSGGTIYGAPRYVPVDEGHPNDPICSYGISKLAIEKYLFLYHQLHGLDYVALRAANPYGPGQSPFSGQGIVASFVHKMHTRQPLEVWGDGSTVRDYFHVQDLVELTTQALFASENGVFNAGSGVGVSVNHLIDTLGAIFDRPAEVVYQPQRNMDVPKIVLDCSAAKERFGWHAMTGLREGIAGYARWYGEHFQSNIRSS